MSTQGQSSLRGGHRDRRIVEAVAFAFLATVIAPQAVLRALSGADTSASVLVGLLGAGVAIVLGYGLYHLTVVAPKTASHKLVGTYLSQTAALASAATRLVAHVLIVGTAAGLAISSLRAFVNLHDYVGLAHALFILVMAIPVLVDIKISERLLGIILAIGLLSVLAAVVTALVIETWGERTWTSVAGVSLDVRLIDVHFGRNFPILAGLVAACLPIAVMGMMTERNFDERSNRRIGIWALAKLMVPAVILILATLYLSNVLGVSGRYYGTPIQYLANVFYGDIGRTALAVSGFLAAVAAALATYERLPGYLRSIAASGMLPRRIAAADERGPRRLVIASVAIICAICTSMMRSTLGITHMLVTVSMVAYGLTMAALIARGRKVLGETTIPEERRQARASIIIGSVGLVIAMALIAAAAASNFGMAVASLLSIIVPTLALVALRRGRGKLKESLTPTDLSAGRTLPTRVHALVLISALDRPALQAITYARATRPSSLTALVVDVDPQMTARLTDDWEKADLPVDLRLLGTPRGAARGPIIDYIRSLRTRNPRDICIVYIPRLVSSSASWQRIGVSRSTPKLVRELRLEPGVIVAEVPYALEEVDND